MIKNKMSPQLQLALRYESLLNEDFRSLYLTRPNSDNWEIVMNFIGDLADIRDNFQMESYDLKGGFAQVFIDKESIGELSEHPNVTFLSLPSRYEYIDIGLGQVCASDIGGNQENPRFNVTGSGVLLAVIDSGIDYSHPDFRDDEGRTRIRYLWDQSLEEVTPGYAYGTVFDQETINLALSQTTREEQLAIVPSQDELGHGTAITGVAAGNGRGSTNQTNRGIAPDAELLIVKLGRPNAPAPTDIEIMLGIDFAIARAQELGMALTILIGVGSSLTGHDGQAPLETYINQRYQSWFCNFVVGTGNEGNTGLHSSGRIAQGDSQDVELVMAGNKVSFACCIWCSFIDDFSLVIEAPNGEQTDELSIITDNRAYLFDNTAVLINFSTPINNIDRREIFILFQGQGSAITNGDWRFILTAQSVLIGDYYIWGSIIREEGDRTRFLNTRIENTITSPSTAEKITSVAAYNGRTLQIASFSGRGYTLDTRIKPELAAPGVTVTVPAANSETFYTTLSGTSVASAFVAGAYLLMLNYGILELGDIDFYGDVLKSYLLKGAQRATSNAPYPNNTWGYGTLCIESALILMEQVASQRS